MSFRQSDKIGRPGIINKKPSGSIWKVVLSGGTGASTSQQIVARTQNGSAAALFLIPSEFSGSWQNGKVILKVDSYLLREQSYAWSTGSGILKYEIRESAGTLYNDEMAMVEGSSACDPADNNVVSGGGIVVPQVQIKDTNALFLVTEIDRPTVTTSCNKTARTELLLTFPETEDSDVTIQEPNWLSSFNSYNIEKIN